MFERSKYNPILKPNPTNSWEESKLYNPAVIYEKGLYHLFYRAMGKNWVSSIGYAVSEDGENFKRFSEPILKAEYEYETRGCEDPRIVKIGGVYFMTYTAYDGITARLNLATSNDLKIWQKHGNILKDWNFTKSLSWPQYALELVKQKFHIKKDWCKAGAIFPEVIDNKYYMLFGDNRIWLASSDDGIHWQPKQEPFITARSGNYFDNYFVEMGPAPIKTELGWLVLYHGIKKVNKSVMYSIGFLVLDSTDPSKILYRSDKPIFWPQEPYELRGVVDILPGGYKVMEKMGHEELEQFLKKYEAKGKMPQVTFCCGATVVNGILKIYYGASDSVICTATAKLEDVLNQVKV